MKKLIAVLMFCGSAIIAKSQVKVSAKEAVNYVGKEVQLCDSVYSSRSLENLSLLNLGGAFPKEVITVVVFKADRAKFEKDPVEMFNEKKICVVGTVTLYKEKLQIVVNDPKKIKLN
ncbi:hypothetical protein [Pedobacter sp. SL55]|uniref:hypothetical protein n=1 Tax=Pedobacter sp. SL55 TaxID=2995161 RepID=UPI00226F2511|nr:hypothetical protein [Pedobacter sp. SL55]WAC40911.1 hypothetical protein OVA16_00540 [Pedobacter sp. SL55]